MEGKKRLLIIGAGHCSKLILNEVRSNKLSYKPIGLIDDNQDLKNKTVYGLPILGSTKEIKKISEEKNIDEILIAIPSLSGERLKEIIDECKQTGKITRIVPAIFDIVQYIAEEHIPPGGKKTIKVLPGEIREVSYEDIIKRSPPEININLIKEVINNNTIIITGAAGSIGRAVTKEVIKLNPKKLILLDMNEYGIHKLQQQAKDKNCEIILGDIKNKEKIEEIIKKNNPDIIIHAAAYKHVDILEKNAYEAIENNILGTYNLIKLAEKYQVNKFVFVSTDKAVEPISVMGYTKRICELMIQNMPKNNTKFSIVRFGNVAGSQGSLFEIWNKQIENKELTVTDVNMTRYFMLLQEAAILILETLILSGNGETFIFDMGSPFNIKNLAKKFIEYHGYEYGKDVKIRIIGIREGEKLDEKLVFDHESLIQTTNKRISMAQSEKDVHKENFFDKIEELKMLNKGNKEEIVNALKSLAD